MTSPASPEQLLCGAHIDAISVEEHVAGSRRTLVSIYIQLRDRPGLRLRTAPGGWGLSMGTDPPQAHDLGDYGSVEIRPAGESLGRATGKVVVAWTVHTPDELIPVGVRWSTASGTDIVIYAYDDTLLVARPGELELGNIAFSSVCGPTTPERVGE